MDRLRIFALFASLRFVTKVQGDPCRSVKTRKVNYLQSSTSLILECVSTPFRNMNR